MTKPPNLTLRIVMYGWRSSMAPPQRRAIAGAQVTCTTGTLGAGDHTLTGSLEEPAQLSLPPRRPARLAATPWVHNPRHRDDA